MGDYKKASTQMMKNINMANVISLIVHKGPVSRADIAKELNMSKSAVSSIIDELIKMGYVKEEGKGEASSNGGRKPINLVFNPDVARVIGINISGYSIRAVLSDLGGNILNSTIYRLDSGEDVIRDVVDIVNKLRDQREVLGVGIGIPGIVNIEEASVVYSPALKWQNVKISKELEEKIGLPVYPENDVKLSALGEKWKGAGVGIDNFIYLSVARGIGCGIIIDDKLYRGSSYTAGEIGYMVLGQRVKESFTLNDFGAFELQAADHAMVRNALKLMDSYSDSYLHKAIRESDSVIKPHMVFAGYELGDKLCQRVIDEYIELLVMGIANLIAVINPRKVILGGDLYYAGDKAMDKIRASVNRLAPFDVTIEKSLLGNNAGCIGGVARVLESIDILKGVLI